MENVVQSEAYRELFLEDFSIQNLTDFYSKGRGKWLMLILNLIGFENLTGFYGGLFSPD